MATYTKHLPDGTTVVLTQEQYDAELAARNAALEASRPKPVIRVSKDKLTRALAAAGKYDAFAAVRNSAPEAERELWYLEPTFITNDPLILQFLPAVKAAIGMSDQELQTLLISCRV